MTIPKICFIYLAVAIVTKHVQELKAHPPTVQQTVITSDLSLILNSFNNCADITTKPFNEITPYLLQVKVPLVVDHVLVQNHNNQWSHRPKYGKVFKAQERCSLIILLENMQDDGEPIPTLTGALDSHYAATEVYCNQRPFFPLFSLLVFLNSQPNQVALTDIEFNLEFSLYKLSPNVLLHLPALFILFAEPQGGLHGWFFCWYCGGENKLHSLGPDLNILQVYHKTTEDGRGVQWSLFNYFDPATNIVEMEVMCSLYKANHNTCTWDELDGLISLTVESLNWTLLSMGKSQDPYASEPTYYYPEIRYGRLPNLEGLDSSIIGELDGFVLITSEGVEKDEASFAAFTMPFSKELWSCLGATVAIIAAFMAACHPCKSLLQTLFVLATLLEQGVDSSRLETYKKVVLFIWLLMAVVITNSYKGLLKSTYMLKPHYVSKYNTLQDIQNFSLIFGFDSDWSDFDRLKFLKSNCKTIEQDLQSDLAEDKAKFWMESCLMRYEAGREMVGRQPCALFDELNTDWGRPIPCIAMKRQNLTKDCSVLVNMYQKVKLVCMGDLDQMVGEDLKRSQTAFVTPRSQFQHDWKRIEKVATKNELRLAHSWGNYDGMFREAFGIGFTTNLAVKNVPAWRLRAALASGLFQVWRKWKMLTKLSAQSEQELEVEAEGAVALSLNNSDVYLVFFVYIVCLLGAISVFIGERLMGLMSVSKRFFNRANMIFLD